VNDEELICFMEVIGPFLFFFEFRKPLLAYSGDVVVEVLG